MIAFGWCALALSPLVVLVWGIWTWCDKADDHIKAGPCQCLRCRCEPGFRESMEAMNGRSDLR